MIAAYVILIAPYLAALGRRPVLARSLWRQHDQTTVVLVGVDHCVR